MRVSIVKNKNIQNIILPEKVDGSFWITGTDSNGIKRNIMSIEAENGKWKLVSNKEIYCINNGIIEQYIYLEKNNFYMIKNDIENSTFLIYCSNVSTNYNYYEISQYLDSGLLIGNGPNTIINYTLLDGDIAIIKKVNNKVYVYDNNSKYGIYVNNTRVLNQTEIKIGDVIFIMGLKMVYVLIDDNNGNLIPYIGVNVNDVFNSSIKLLPSNLLQQLIGFEESDEEIEYQLFDEKEYFHKTPRFIKTIKPLVLQVDAPPSKNDEKNNPLLLTIGPMITMSMTSLVTGYTAISGVLNGQSTWANATPSLIVCGAMFASMFIWPIFTKKYEKRQRKKEEKLRQEKYSAYIEEKRKVIVSAKQEQENILINNFPEISEIQELILNRYVTLWQRRIEDSDFLKINIGIGQIPMKIDIKYPEDHFSMVEDNLKDMVSKLGNEPKLLSNVPIVYSIYDHFISGLVGDDQISNEYMKRLILQLLAFHSYEDLKIIILTDEEKEEQWKFLKNAPHCFSDDRKTRFFATNNDEYQEICYYLDRVFALRKEKMGSEPIITNSDKTYLIITDSFRKVRDYEVIKKILKSKKNYGFMLFILDNKITNLPDQCSTFININKNQGEFHNNENYAEVITFKVDLVTPIDYESCIKKLANIPIEFDVETDSKMPEKVGFLEMFDVGKIEQINALARWQKSNPMMNLSAPVGIGKSGEKISIDLHEKFHGPHGLIAGMTGSGKSEFIITYILSMAINYHPYEVQFILIDYKGGGLAGAFENKTIGLKLPHLVGTITNLDVNEIKRSLSSIESELKRRQALFNEARELTNESTIDIYKYQKMYRAGLVKEPVSHLFIISDEFAELKNQQPEFMEQLISTARIGRSLGVHLILATQKPSGVVDPQIWSNTRFRICMKVQDKSDSNEVIKCPDAAFLKQTGRFYFQVGYNEVFVLGQAAWAGGKYIPSERYNKTIDTSIDFINPVGYIVKSMETKPKNEKVSASNGEELLNIVKYLSEIANQQNIKCRPLWLEKIPREIRIEDLAIKYNYQKVNFVVNPIVGEYDVPSNQEQRLLTLPLTDDGNTLIYGATGSGKENFIITLIYSSMLYYTPEEINYYIIDFGSGALNMFSKCPIVGDILKPEEEDKVENLYKMIKNIIDERKKLFSDFGGDYQSYLKNSGKSVPNLVIIINNYESYQELYEKFEDELTMLTRECNKYGIYFIFALSTPNGLRFKLKQNFALTYVLQQNNEDDYVSILGSVNKNYPAKIFGRGIIKTDSVYEFQTAFATDKDNITKYIKEKCNYYSTKYDVVAKKVPVLPNTVIFENIYSEKIKENELLIGLNKNDLSSSKININKNYISLVIAMDLNDTNKFINNVIKQMIRRDFKSLLVINAEDYEIDLNYINKYQYVNKKFDSIFDKLYNFVNQQYETYESNNYDKSIFNNIKPLNCIIIGINSFKNKLSSDNQDKYSDLFIKAKDLGIINFIIVDSINEFKSIEYDNWYKNTVDNSTGIWIGNGINDQFSLKINQKIPELRENDVPESFCFVIHKGKPKYVKYIEKV